MCCGRYANAFKVKYQNVFDLILITNTFLNFCVRHKLHATVYVLPQLFARLRFEILVYWIGIYMVVVYE